MHALGQHQNQIRVEGDDGEEALPSSLEMKKIVSFGDSAALVLLDVASLDFGPPHHEIDPFPFDRNPFLVPSPSPFSRGPSSAVGVSQYWNSLPFLSPFDVGEIARRLLRCARASRQLTATLDAPLQVRDTSLGTWLL